MIERPLSLDKVAFSKKLTPLLKPVIEELGYKFVGLQSLSEEGNLILRVYADSENGIAIEDCEKISRRVEEYLDSKQLMGEVRYYLEVSSPGIERPLFSASDFAEFAGRSVQITLKENLDGKRQLKGVILSVDGEQIKVLSEKNTQNEVSYTSIEEAHLVFLETKGQKKLFKKKGVK